MKSENHCDRSHVNKDSQRGPIPISLHCQFQKRRQMSLKCLESPPKCFYPCMTQKPKWQKKSDYISLCGLSEKSIDPDKSFLKSPTKSNRFL